MQTGNKKNKQERQVAIYKQVLVFFHSKMQIKSHRRIIPIINIIKTNKPSKSRHVRQRIFFILANYFKGKQGKS